MRKFLVLILVGAALSGSSQVSAPEGEGLYIYDSAWSSVAPSSLVAAKSKAFAATAKAAELPDVLDAVEAYNAETTDDQLFVYTEAVPVEEAPFATGYICDSVTLEVYFQATVPRIELTTNREAWRTTTEIMSDPITGERLTCTLYVDHIPPEPIIEEPPVPQLCLALIDYTDMIIFAAEICPDVDTANQRNIMYLLQRDLNIQADGHDWQVYRGIDPFSFPIAEDPIEE